MTFLFDSGWNNITQKGCKELSEAKWCLKLLNLGHFIFMQERIGFETRGVNGWLRVVVTMRIWKSSTCVSSFECSETSFLRIFDP